jgi:hypothetical protein
MWVQGGQVITIEESIEMWRKQILDGWERWGSGTPLDPRTVDHLAREFAKPIQFPVAKPLIDWNKEKL